MLLTNATPINSINFFLKIKRELKDGKNGSLGKQEFQEVKGTGSSRLNLSRRYSQDSVNN